MRVSRVASVKGLFDDVHAGPGGAVAVEDGLSVAGHVEDREARAVLADLRGDLGAGHVGHDDVGQEQVDPLGRVAREEHRVRGVGRLVDAVVVAGEDPVGQFAEALLVLHEEDRLTVAPESLAVWRGDGYDRRSGAGAAGSRALIVVPRPGSE